MPFFAPPIHVIPPAARYNPETWNLRAGLPKKGLFSKLVAEKILIAIREGLKKGGTRCADDWKGLACRVQ